jgi:hypothetical protein
MRWLLAAVVGMVAAPLAPVLAAPYVPPAAADVPGYSAEALPCRVSIETLDHNLRSIDVTCKTKLLDDKTLRELAIMRNTIYARYGWDGFRKQWLHDYFHGQKWFKPNPDFSYKLISKADRENAHVIGSKEASFNEESLRARQEEIYSRHGRVAGIDIAEKDFTPDERIELGLISRALGGFSTDDESRSRAEQSLDHLLALADLRKLSLRDLRLLRNSIYARRGRPFKSPIVREHFRGMKWYRENTAYTDKLLSQTDVRNVRLIRSVEDELGGALRDEDWLIEPAIDGA